jgi:hypothetical protein
MLWRVVVLALVPLVPLPGFAHAHAEYTAHDPSGIDRPPHFHLRSFYDWALDSQSTAENEDHDKDAVYVSASVVLGRGAEQPVADAADGSTPLTSLAPVVCPESAQGTLLRSSDPPRCLYSCAIYLRSRALLI